jgi:hypothetical protein
MTAPTEMVPAVADDEFVAAFRGELIGPYHPAYDEARAVYNGMIDRRPAMIAHCRDAADVMAAVRLAGRMGMPTAVRGGGHNAGGLGVVDDGLVIDLSEMRGIRVDPDRRTVRAEGGALLGDMDHATHPFGLAVPCGVLSTTGVGGLTLGGGYGWLRRKHGLSCDNVVSAQVVTADGQVHTASADVNPDLYWAIRGGGGNFGIVTSFTFRLHPVGPTVAFVGVFYPLADAAALLRGFRSFAEGAPDEVTAEVITLTMPADPHLPEPIQDQPCFAVAAVYAGDPEKGMEVLQPLRELGMPLADISTPMPYRMVQSAFDPFFPRGQFHSYWKAVYLSELADDVIDLIAAKAQDRPAPLTLFVVWLMGGKVNRVGAEETAFGERSAPFMVTVDGNWTDPNENAENIGWVRDRFSELSEFGTGSTYLNFTGHAGESTDVGVDDAYGRNLKRLGEIKAKYDPDNFFRRNNNIAPA